MFKLSSLALALFVMGAAAVYAYGPPESYGSLNVKPKTDYKPVVPPPSNEWKSAKYAMVTSDLSPAVLYINRTPEQHLFSKLSQWRLGGPTAIAYMGPGPNLQAQIAQGVEIPNPRMVEPWLLVWFTGSRGWFQWDSPWLVVLQHTPTDIESGEDGLTLKFEKEAGTIAAMPLFGYYKPHQKPLDTPRLTTDKVFSTAAWAGGVPTNDIMRARYWVQVLRSYPLYCHETFSVDRSKDRLTLREEFTWLPISDDWKTKPIKLAPLSPSLALAYGDKRFPMQISEKVADPDLMTPYGPYLGVEGKDRFDINLDVLQYVNETEVQQEPDLVTHPDAQPAFDLVQKAMAEKFPNADGKWTVDFGEGNFCWAAMSDRWYPKGLAYVDEVTRANAKKSLHNYFADYVLKEERFKPFKGMLLLTGPGIGTWGGYDDAGKFSANLLLSVWSYAHYTGDWDLIRERWPLIKKLFITPLESDWKTFGRAAIAEMGDEAPPPLAFARMAYKIGDIDTYNYACYIFGREILHQFIKQNGAQYFRKYQPYHSMEEMPENVFITNLWGDTAGWQIDGPTYPMETGERQYNNRWIRYGNEDTARFQRDTLETDVKKELDGYVEAGKSSYKLGEDDGHIAPSMERIRSLLLNESPEDLAKLSSPDQWRQQPNSGKVAFGLSYLRVTRPTQVARIIPKEGKPSPFVLGLEREVEGGFSGLVQNPVWEYKPKQGDPVAYWPVPVWHFWKPPASVKDHPVGDRWPFGESRPSGPERPKSAKTTRLNWNTQATAFEF